MEKIVNDYTMTSNEELDCLQLGDSSSEVIGVITQLDPPLLKRRSNFNSNRSSMGADNNSNTNNSKKQQSEKADNTPFRCILSNLTGRQIRLLFWMPKKKEFEGCILKQIVKISRPQIILANPAFNVGRDDLMKIELSINSTATVELLGPMPKEDEVEMFKTIDFANVPLHVGEMVCVQGFIRTSIIVLTTGNSSYGNGSVTDFYYRIPVYVSKFDGVIEKGARVEIKGRIRINDQNTIILQVIDGEHINVIKENDVSWDKMKLGFHPLLPINSSSNDDDKETQQTLRRKSVSSDQSIPSKVSKQGKEDDGEFDDIDLSTL